MDFLKTNQTVQAQRDKSFTVKMTVGEMLDLLGEDNVKKMVQEKTAEAAFKPEYELTGGNLAINWMALCVFIVGFALLATIALELIDKDKR